MARVTEAFIGRHEPTVQMRCRSHDDAVGRISGHRVIHSTCPLGDFTAYRLDSQLRQQPQVAQPLVERNDERQAAASNGSRYLEDADG
jgi:hypothetical protein